MKNQLKFAILALALSSFTATSFAQGSLTPTNTPAPTMKSLAQIEARTPISSVPFTITQPGSYYLSGNVTVTGGTAVTIAASGVTLDLNGFTISSTSPAGDGYGININAWLHNLAIVNGSIQSGTTNNGSGVYSGPGFQSGIYGMSVGVFNVRVKDVAVIGCQYYGIYLSTSDATVVESCTVQRIGGTGISASTIKGSQAIDCGGSAISGSQVSDCRGQCTVSGYGIYSITALNCHGTSFNGSGVYATTALNCYGTSDSGIGVYATTAQNCFGNSSSGTGIYASRVAIGCYGQSTSGTGLYAQNANTCTGYRAGGTAISATVANGCYSAFGNNSITYKYNMP